MAGVEHVVACCDEPHTETLDVTCSPPVKYAEFQERLAAARRDR